MNTIKKTLRLNREEYYAKHLAIINPLLPEHLTPKEIEVLAHFMCLNGTIAEDRFGTTARKFVMRSLSLTLPGLSNHLRALKKKGFVKENTIQPILFPENDSQDYYFKLVNQSS